MSVVGLLDTIGRITRGNFEDKTKEEREAAAREVILTASLATAGLVLQPLPGLEHGAIPLQVVMVIGLSRVFGEELSRKRAKAVLMDLAAATGVNIAGRQALTTLAKVVLPGLGGVLAAPAAFALTWATGHVAMHYFSAGGKLDRARLRAIFEQEKRRAKAHYSEGGARDARPEARDVEDNDGPVG